MKELPKPIKIVHFGDVHLGMENYGKIDPETGLNSRLKDFTRAFDNIIDFILQKKIDLVIFAGDAYKTRDPSPTYQREFASRIFKIASHNIPVVMVVGNHDFPNALGKANTLDIFQTLSVPNVHIFRKADVLTIKTANGPIQVAGLPWLTRGNLLSKDEFMQKKAEDLNRLATQKLTERVMLLSSRINPDIPAVMVAHASIESALYGAERQVTIGSELTLPLDAFRQSNFQAVFLGHLHKHQEIKGPGGLPLIYSGSIERVDFGEEKEPKGFVLAVISKLNNKFLTQISFEKLAARQFITIRVKITTHDQDPTAKILAEIKQHDLKDAIVKVMIEIPEDKFLEISEGLIRESLHEASFIAGINKEVRKDERLNIKEGYSDEFQSLDPIGLLEKFLNSKKIAKERIAILKKETQKLLEEEILI